MLTFILVIDLCENDPSELFQRIPMDEVNVEEFERENGPCPVCAKFRCLGYGVPDKQFHGKRQAHSLSVLVMRVWLIE